MELWFQSRSKQHCVNCVQIRSYFWSVFSCIRTEYGPEITPYLDTFLDTFHAVQQKANRLCISNSPQRLRGFGYRNCVKLPVFRRNFLHMSIVLIFLYIVFGTIVTLIGMTMFNFSFSLVLIMSRFIRQILLCREKRLILILSCFIIS